MPATLWDLFCRVIDNHGDLGVCWRLARDLAQRGVAVRLWVDDASALAWMAPVAPPGITVLPWREDDPPMPGEVVVEAFGCDPPAAFVARMHERATPPVWINLEYLSAEDYVARSHGLMSPVMSGPGAGLRKWFFYPGFTARTGGLLREPGLLKVLDAEDASAMLADLGVQRSPGERVVSVFCYPSAPLASLPGWLSGQPTLLLATPGAATQALAASICPPGVRVQALPWLPQPDYDRLLAACDLNLVRGEDSLVRAIWAGRPFLWQLYVQDDGVHADKLEAFLGRLLAPADGPLGARVADAFRFWNRIAEGADVGVSAGRRPPLPPLSDWQALARRFRAECAAQDDLTTQLLAFVAQKR